MLTVLPHWPFDNSGALWTDKSPGPSIDALLPSRLWTRCRTELRIRLFRNQETDGVQAPDDDASRPLDNRLRSISECYFAVKGAALVLPQNECMHVYRKSTTNGGDIQQHLQSMFYLLRPEDTLKMAVKLESMHMGRTRYLVVVSYNGHHSLEESCLLGIDCNEKATIGLVLPVWADTQITLDGDGGFSVSSSGRHHIFKPVSVQAMWSALQTLHKASAKAREYNFFAGGLTHTWIEYYEKRIQSDRSCLNEWHAMDDLESRRPPSPDSLRLRPTERDATEQYIRVKLKEIMMLVDLDEVTSKYIRTKLEEDMNMDLHEYKSFIDQEMIIILGQMDAATEIFEYLYLGSEWNASNLEELQKNRVGHILNVTREIDNFFPGMFEYLNIRVYDEEGTELLKHWDKTYKFIEKAKRSGSKVLVHCKMGVSRSASVVIAYAMKAYDWNMQNAHKFVKNKRSCIKPNGGFMKQLEIYQGILDASKQRHNMLWRSKSETNLKSPHDDSKSPTEEMKPKANPHDALYLEMPSPGHRPKSWSPEDNVADLLFKEKNSEVSEKEGEKLPSIRTETDASRTRSFTDPTSDSIVEAKNKHVLLPCSNGQSYSVSPNKALHLSVQMPSVTASAPDKVAFCIGDSDDSPVFECCNPLYVEDVGDEVLHQVVPHTIPRVSSVKDRISELELQAEQQQKGLAKDKLDLPAIRGLVLNLTNQFESASKPNTPSPTDDSDLPPSSPLVVHSVPICCQTASKSPLLQGNEPVVAQMKPPAPRHQAVLISTETWVSEEEPPTVDYSQSFSGQRAMEYVKQKDNLIMKLRVNDHSISPSLSPSVNPKSAGKSDSAQVSCSPASPAPETLENSHLKDKQKRPNSLSSSGSQTPPVIRKDDPFSAQLDRVFEREERTQQALMQSVDGRTQIPSRQSSWGSCDSAIVIQAPNPRESPSRQSSFGSVDSRSTLLSRESSWGSADYRGGAIPTPLLTDNIRKASIASMPESQYSTSNGERTTFTYDQEDIPFIPGSVKKTRQKLEESSSNQSTLKRTNSFDGSFTAQLSDSSHSSPSQNSPSPIQRSRSLRTDDRSSQLGRYPTPNLKLHGPMPYRSPTEKSLPTNLDISNLESVQPISTPNTPKDIHYASYPILPHNLEDRVACPLHSASQPDIPNSALPPIPNPVGQAKARAALRLDLGNNVCQPSKNSFKNNLSSNSPPVSDSSLIGIVQQHRQALENKLAATPNPTPSGTLDNKDHLKYIRDLGRTVIQPLSPENDDNGLSKVKRITQEIELKAGATPLKRERVVIVDQQGKELGNKSQQTHHHNIERSHSSPAVQNMNGEDLSADVLQDDNSVRSLVGKFEEGDPRRTRYHSENEVELQKLDIQALGPLGLRKLSLDTDSSWTQHTNSVSAPKQHNAKNVCSNSGQNSYSCSSSCGLPVNCSWMNSFPENPSPQYGAPTRCTGGGCTSSSSKTLLVTSNKPPPPVKSVPEPPDVAPPTGGGPRKVRKLHGKTHPLNKLLPKQRTLNPLYNTM